MRSPRARSGTIPMPTGLSGSPPSRASGALFATVLAGEVYRRDFASRRRLGSCPDLAGRPWGAADRAATGVSPGSGTPGPAAPPSNASGCGCATGPKARSASGSASASACKSDAPGAAPSPCGAASKPASSLTAPYSRPDSSAHGDDRIQSASDVSVSGPLWEMPALTTARSNPSGLAAASAIPSVIRVSSATSSCRPKAFPPALSMRFCVAAVSARSIRTTSAPSRA